MKVYTKKQIDEGKIDISTIDLDKYAQKTDVVGKEEFENLTEVVSNKLDASPMHEHDISQIDGLQNKLNDKLDATKKYGYQTLISNINEVDYLDKLSSLNINVVSGTNDEVYSFVENSVGDLNIIKNNNVIAQFVKSQNQWTFSGITEVLENHKQAIEQLANGGTTTNNTLTVSYESADTTTCYEIVFIKGSESYGIEADTIVDESLIVSTDPLTLNLHLKKNDEFINWDNVGNKVTFKWVQDDIVKYSYTTSSFDEDGSAIVTWTDNVPEELLGMKIVPNAFVVAPIQETVEETVEEAINNIHKILTKVINHMYY